MPKKFEILQHNISVIADVICDQVSDISDVNFYERSDGSLCHIVITFRLYIFVMLLFNIIRN